MEYKNAVDASCKEGYEGDLYCTDCGAFLSKGLTYPAIAPHDYEKNSDGTKEICKTCGDTKDLPKADAPQSDAPDADDGEEESESNLLLIIAIAGGSAVVAAILLVVLKKRKA